MCERRNSIICFVARPWGYLCLKALLDRKDFSIRGVFTHRTVPYSENPQRPERKDFKDFVEICQLHSIPLHTAETKREAMELIPYIKELAPFDFILSCSWRFLISREVIDMARIGTVNLHRGKLPEYRGAEPVKRALENGEKEIFLSAHKIAPEYDTGEILYEASVPAGVREGETLEQAVGRLKMELYPEYPVAMFGALAKYKNE